MRKTIIEQDLMYAEGRRLIKHLWRVEKSEHYPLGLEFSIQVLVFENGKWTQRARIDNQLHRGLPGTHIHIGKKVIWKEVPFEKAEETIIDMAEKIMMRKHK